MNIRMTALGCALMLGTVSSAMAGAYGEPSNAEELPAAAPAAAAPVEETPDYAQTGFYLGAGGVYAIEGFDEIKGASGIDVGNSSGFHVRAGYRAHANFAVEALYENFTEFDTDGSGHYDGYQISVNGKGYILTGRVQPYALVGLGYTNINAERTPGLAAPGGDDFMMRFGGGIDACITEHLAMGPEVAWVLPFGEANNLDMTTISLGLRYKF